MEGAPYSQWVAIRGAAKHPPMYRTPPTSAENYPAPKVRGAEVGQFCFIPEAVDLQPPLPVGVAPTSTLVWMFSLTFSPSMSCF